MHFLFEAEPEFTWPIDIKAPSNGAWETVSLQATFRLLSAEAITKIIDNADGEQALLKRITVAIAMPNDSANSPALSAAQQQRILGYSIVQRALLHGYQQAILGQEEKN